MALPFYNWSMTASSNANADSTVNWSEGQLPSTVNDSARAMMASTAAFAHDISGGITTAGTSTAYTVSSGQVFDTLGHLSSQIIAFNAHATNTNTVGNDVTLNVDGLGAKPIRMQPSVALPNGSLILGTVYVVMYNAGDAVFYLRNMTNPYSVPVAGGMDYWGTSAPNSSFAFPLGQALNRTTYATLFSIMGTTYGTGDGSTTFNLPDKGGRVSAMKEASASRLTSTYFGGNSTALGAVGGAESHTLTTAELASHSHTGTTDTENQNHTHPTVSPVLFTSGSIIASGGSIEYVNPTGANTGVNSVNHTHTFTSNTSGSGNAHAIVQPTIVCNYIIRVI